MASGIITVIVGAALEKFKSTAMDNIQLMLGFPEQLDAMKAHVQVIKAVLDDADSKKSGSGSDSVSLWLNNVEGVAFEAEIVLDKLLYESLRRRVSENNGGTPEVREKCSSFLFMLESRIRDVYLSMMLGPSVRSINERFKELKSQIETLRLVNGERHVTDHVAANRETNSATRRLVVGRKKEEREIVKLLLDSSNNNFDVSVLPIVGMGGLGKTTLAKSVYNNQQIVNQFSKRSWTCVSNKVGCTDILKGILESLNGGSSVGQGQDAIVQGVKKELNGQRFLFVLDDVWKFQWWEDLLDILTHMAKIGSTGGGCCVLITTRSREVANGVRVFFSSPFELKLLSGDHCWSIIVETVKESGNMPEGLDVHREKLLKKCQGLPLAANIIGGLLHRGDWRLIVDRILKIQDDVDDKIMAILRLSYDYLPSRCLKSCFVYCSVYPKDTVMDGDKLIELWMAQGYLQEGVEGGRTMEEVGASYLTILLQSSLLEKCYKKDSLRYQMQELNYQMPDLVYQMHDLVHDLAESLSREKHVGGEFRHFELGDKWLKYKWNEKSKLVGIEEGDICDAMLSNCIHARVMHLHLSSEIKILANNVGMLIHVRSLSISGFKIESLPESLCRLYNLQTLDLRGCFNLQCLPQGFSDLISLRHLHVRRGEGFKMAPNMGRLTRLQTLGYFNVGEENGCEIKELGSMKNLKGSLSIRNLKLVKGKEEASSANLVGKRNLTKLELNWNESLYRGGPTTERKGDEQVLEGLEPCPGLQELQISNYMGVPCPGWLGKLSSLVSLELHGCENMRELGYSGDIDGCHQLSSARTSFPILERLFLSIIQVSTVRDIISKSGTNSLQELSLVRVSGMTCLSDVIESSLSSCLTRLYIHICGELTEIPSSTLECCTCLEELSVWGCPELASFPLNLQKTPSLSSIEISDCSKLFTRDAVLPRGFEHLTNLKDLEIGPDNSEQSIDWEGLRKGCSTTLRQLNMLGSSRTQLPQQLQDFSSLVWLTISEFDSLERLPGWLGKLTSLRRLRLDNCPKLEHLPTDAIRSLTNLRELHLVYCPKLEHLPTDAIGSLTNLQQLEISRCPLLRETQGDEIKKALPKLKVDWTD